MPQSVYRVTTDQGSYDVTVGETDAPTTSAKPSPAGGMTEAQWAALSSGEKARNFLKWGGKALGNAVGMGAPGAVSPINDAIENPGTTLATAAVAGAAPKIAQMIPTKAKAGAKFQQVMDKVGKEPIDIAKPGDAALRIQQMSERGGSMPKVVRDLLKRATDPAKGDIDYQEARDFYSNISRLSADEYQRLTPAVRMEVGKLRVALNRALAQTAAKGGMEDTYRSAMKQYKVAARTRELAEAAAKWGAGAVGVGAAYKLGQTLLD